MITVEDVWARALPPSTTLAAGERGLRRAVTWVAALSSRPPAFVGLKGGELALLSDRGLRELDEKLSLPEVLERLAEVGVATAAFQGEISARASTVADRRDLPLLALPPDADLQEVERQIIHLLVEQRSDLHRRGHEISSQLNELVIDGRSTVDLVDRLAVLAGRIVALERADQDTLHLVIPRGQAADRHALVAALAAARSAALDWAERQSFSPSNPPAARFDLPETGLARLVAPLALANGLVGLLSIVALPGRLGELERLAASHGAIAGALALSRERAILAAEDRLQRSLLDELLSDSPLDIASLAGRASRLGYNFDLPHLALLVSVSPPEPGRNGFDPAATLARVAELLTRDLEPAVGQPAIRPNGTTLAALLPLRPRVDERHLRAVVRRLHEQVAAQLRPLLVSIGAAGPRTGLPGLRAAHREAEQALALGAQLYGLGHLTHFGDLGLYRLLYRLHGTPEAEEFCREVLGALEAYDQQHGSDLIPTLEAYFAAGASPKETAAGLHLHRNTVLYRLQRIADIAAVSLDDPATRLSLQIALRLRQTTRAASVSTPDQPRSVIGGR